MRRRRWHQCVAWLTVCIGVAAVPTIAVADSAGPTNYETTIVEVQPPTDGVVEFTIEGSDSFVRSTVARGHTLMVLGYDDEPYIRIDEDGSVWENVRSESYYYNLERFGGDVPATADSNAPPEWKQADDDGEYAWHDHRAHLMTPLIGLEPGQSLPPETIDVLVDGVATQVTVSTTRRPTASPLWIALGAAIGLAGCVLAFQGIPGGPLRVGLLFSGFASIVGIAHTLSVPASTGRPLWWWLPPVLALATMLLGFAVRSDVTLVGIIAVGVGLELLIWGGLRLDGLAAAYRPTVLPVDVDRVLSVALPIAGLGLVLAGVRALITQRRAADYSRSARSLRS